MLQRENIFKINSLALDRATCGLNTQLYFVALVASSKLQIEALQRSGHRYKTPTPTGQT